MEAEQQILSLAQQEYFKGSKLRDQEGELIQCLHYTDKEFDAFDLDKIGSSQGDVGYCGKGIYFTSMTSFGKSFGKYCLDCYINMENPLIVQELEDWQKENLLEYFAKSDEYKAGKLPRLAGHPQKKENRLKDDLDEVLQGRNFEDEDINQLCEDLTNTREYDSFLETGNIEEIQDTDEFRELMGNDEFAAKVDDYCLRDYVEMEPYGTKDLTSDKFHYGYWVSYAAQLTEWAKDNGFDGILSERNARGQIREIVVFEPNQIKSVDNLYPTKSDNFKDNSIEYVGTHGISLAEKLEVVKYIKSKGIGIGDGSGAPPAHSREREER